MAAEDVMDFDYDVDDEGWRPQPRKSFWIPIPGLPRHGEPWTGDEEARLSHLWDKRHLSIDDLSREFGRTKNAIIARLELLGIDPDETKRTMTVLKSHGILAKKVNNAMTQNLQHLLALLQKGYTTVAVHFQNMDTGADQTTQSYTYKVPESVAKTLVKGDQLVVPARKGLAVVRVVEVHATPQIDVKNPLALKWVVCKVDRAAYDDQADREARAIAQVEVAERRKAQEEALQTLLGNAEDREAFLQLISPQ